MSKLYNQPSPPAKSTWSTPPRLPHAGEDHCPCMMLFPGELSVHMTAPVCLFNARKLGALGCAITLCASSTPFEVLTNSTSPRAVTEQLHALCGEAPSLPIMSIFQMMSASSLFSFGSSLKGPSFLPSRNPSV